MEKTKEKSKKDDFKIDPAEMMQVGLHFGHKTSKVHPKIKPFLYGARNGVHIFDFEKTTESIKAALEFIKKIISEGKVMVLVGTKVQIKKILVETAKECGLPYIADRWLGGTFTNFDTIKRRVDYLKELEEKKASGGLDKYTKKERANFDKELDGLRLKFEGLKELKGLPEAVFVCDMKKDILAVKEARAKGVKVIGIADTNIDPTLADYPIPANDDAKAGVKFILDKVKEVVLKAKSEPPASEGKGEKKTKSSLKAESKK